MGVAFCITVLMLYLTLILNQHNEKKHTMATGTPLSHLCLCL